MTKEAAIYKFFSHFLDAYEENSLYDAKEPPEFPYLTYQLRTGAFDNNSNGTPMTVNLYYRSETLVDINAKTAEISQAIGRSGKILTCDDGHILIRRQDTNFAESSADAGDERVKRKVINLMIEFFSND